MGNDIYKKGRFVSDGWHKRHVKVLSDEVEVMDEDGGESTGRDAWQIVHYFITEFEFLNVTSCG